MWQNGDYGVIGIHVNGTHKCCIGTDYVDSKKYIYIFLTQLGKCENDIINY